MVYRNTHYIGYKWYYDQFHYPFIIAENDYKAGDTILIKVLWDWNKSPAKDYTLKIYSQHKGVKILNSSEDSNMYHMDG